jgi:hypothetical protein
MNSRYRNLRLRLSEDGQAMIFTAIVFSTLMLIMGLAIEGGRVYTEYRKVQAAADMAALVGAQTLPCGTSSTTGVACQTTAKSNACTTAAQNGIDTSACTASVPPAVCSPYDTLQYGNLLCSTLSTTLYDYIEVKLTDNLGTIPIFGTQVNLSAHAVAKGGGPANSNFAIVQLDQSGCLTLKGTADVAIGGAVYANGCINQVSSHDRFSCAGEWLSAGSGADSNTLVTNGNGTVSYAPSNTGSGECVGGTGINGDGTSSVPSIGNPYCTAFACPVPPPTLNSAGTAPAGGSGWTGCSQCSNYGYWRVLPTGTWTSGATTAISCPSGSTCEALPGVYLSQFSVAGQVLFNPGVYTFTLGFDTNHGAWCVFGAPDCENGNTSLGNDSSGNPFDCSTDTFTSSGVAATEAAASATWYYYCSPYGYWDSVGALLAVGAGYSSATAPQYYNADNPTSSTGLPMNGVTLYLGASGQLSEGNSGTNTYLAASDPCAGTGTENDKSVTWQDFPPDGVSGATGGTYKYQTSIFTGLPFNFERSSSSAMIYPNVDFTGADKCLDGGLSFEDWPGEYPKGPLKMHMVIYAPAGGKMGGASAQNWFGSIYVPNGSLTIDGAGKGNGGPPFVTGQIIAFDLTFTGTAATDVTYLECSSSNPCTSGHGTQLIQ